MTRDAAFEDWIDAAKRVSIRDEMARRGLWSKRMENDGGAPCPGCGGHDRFAVNTRKDVFNCRQCGAAGGVVSLVMLIEGCSFLTACEILTGEPAPGRMATDTIAARQAREAAAIARATADQAKRLKADADERYYRAHERTAARAIWCAAQPIAGTPAADYLAQRGLVAPPGAHLRFAPAAKLVAADKRTLIHTGPALVAGVTGPDGRFAGVEQIWLDRAQPKGKLLIVDPTTGNIAPAKKMRGSMRGGTVFLGPSRRAFGAPQDEGDGRAFGAPQDEGDGRAFGAPQDEGDGRAFGAPQDEGDGRAFGAPQDKGDGRTFGAPQDEGDGRGGVATDRRLFLGEGIETVLAVYSALAAAGSASLDGAAFRAALSLGNLAGKAAGKIAHPTATHTDTRGRVRRVFVASDVPVDAADDVPMIAIADTIDELILLGDGNSEPFFTQMAMQRAAARFARAYPRLGIATVWPRAGQDFDDQWRDERKRMETAA